MMPEVALQVEPARSRSSAAAPVALTPTRGAISAAELLALILDDLEQELSLPRLVRGDVATGLTVAFRHVERIARDQRLLPAGAPW